MTRTYLILIVLAAVNFVAFCAFGIDKYKARHDRWRVPERVLLLLAIFGGAIGAFAGMRVFHHKTQHKKFTILVPLFALAQMAAAFWLFGWI